MEILEGNKTIAQFMDANVFIGKDYFENECEMVTYSNEKKPPHTHGITHFVAHLEYHVSWDWLMPVVKKCWIDPTNDKMDELTNKFDFWEIDKMWDAVIKYIQWKNIKDGI